jgi:CHAD domain-containing protein
MGRVTTYRVREGSDPLRLLDDLAQHAHLVRDRGRTVERVVYETFDWRFLSADSVLEHRRHPDGAALLVWRSLSTGEVLGQLPIDEVPPFVWHLPSTPFVERLARITEVRAIVPLVTLDTDLDVSRLVDGDGKTLARVTLDRSTVEGAGPLPPVIELSPVRGYDDEARRLAALLAAQVALTPQPEDVITTALRAVGFAPGSYSSKLRLHLDPESTALDAWTTVLRALFATMQANEGGLRDDVDSEFLHDFRVAVRRTRSVLADSKGILDADTRAWAREEFRWIGQVTSPPRDADVFLLTLPEFEAALPEARRGDLKPFGAFLEEQQTRAHADLVASLDSERYAALVARWRGLLDEGLPAAADADASAPAVEIAGAHITKAHRRVIRDGRAINAASHPEELHELRKEAKRLRYLLECFGSLFATDLVAPVVRELKGLQDVLGDYQDNQVQAEAIERLGQQMIEGRDVPAATLIAMGGIVEHLDVRGDEARDRFAARFAQFDTKAVRRAVQSLRSAPASGRSA